MEVKEIIKQCLSLINIEDFTSKATLTEEEERIKAKLMAHLNLVYKEIASEYLPFIATETVLANNGFDCSELSENVIKIKKIVGGGFEIPFDEYPSYVKFTFCGNVQVEYRYLPSDLTYLDYIEDTRLRITHLTYGVLSQYYFENGLYELASHFDKKFLDGIKSVKYSKNIVLPIRRFL